MSRPDIQGVTYSGGEPMEQAEALWALTQRLKEMSNLSIVCYTGYRLEYLRDQGTEAQKVLLQSIDLLIDGVYRKDQHANLLWRGSANQRLLALSPRYQSLLASLADESDRSAGLEFFLDANGSPAFAGVPPIAGFREDFERRMKQRGVLLAVNE